jgi:hypothetical protein
LDQNAERKETRWVDRKGKQRFEPNAVKKETRYRDRKRNAEI